MTEPPPSPADPARLAGRVALVTGAAGDIGRATAVRLADAGATMVLCDLERAASGLADTAEHCHRAHPDGRAALQSRFDVTDPEAVQQALPQVAAEVGAPDAIFNNAGYQGLFSNTIDYPSDEFARVMAINVTGVFNVLQAAAEVMVGAAKPGAIVNTASMAATGAPNMVAYSASKAAVIGLTKSAAKDLAPHGIRVNAISPAFIGPGAMWERQVELQAGVPSQYYADDADTVAQQMIEQVPLRRYGTLDEVAAAVAFLLSDEASYLTGVNLEVSGGIG